VPKSTRRNSENVEKISFNKIFDTKISSTAFISKTIAGRPFLKLKAHNIQGTWLYDTGASVTCMSLKEFRKIPPVSRPPKLRSNLRLISAAKTILKVTGMYMLQLEILGKTVTHPVHICESMNQVSIIGMDVIA
jgi:hypothetical protein